MSKAIANRARKLLDQHLAMCHSQSRVAPAAREALRAELQDVLDKCRRAHSDDIDQIILALEEAVKS